MKQVNISLGKKDKGYIFYIEIDNVSHNIIVKKIHDIDKVLISLFGLNNVIRIEIIEYINDYEYSEYGFNICAFNEFLKDLLRSEGLYKEEIEYCDYCNSELVWNDFKDRSVCTNKKCNNN